MDNLPKIGIDLDGVLINHGPAKLELAARYGIELEPWQTNTNVIRRFVPDAVYLKMQSELYGPLTPSAPIMPGAFEALAALDADFHIVSSRHAESIRHVQTWLMRNRLYDIVPAERIYFCGTGEDKRAHCERLGLQVFLDDKLAVLEALPGGIERVLFDGDGAYSHLEPQGWLTAVSSWPEFRRFLTE
jgi:hypothetical protein